MHGIFSSVNRKFGHNPLSCYASTCWAQSEALEQPNIKSVWSTNLGAICDPDTHCLK